ncbi:hypothetical protein Hdeb2414_s0003g00101171 [Helianthus debilis subsp. tardiflorus]
MTDRPHPPFDSPASPSHPPPLPLDRLRRPEEEPVEPRLPAVRLVRQAPLLISSRLFSGSHTGEPAVFPAVRRGSLGGRIGDDSPSRGSTSFDRRSTASDVSGGYYLQRLVLGSLGSYIKRSWVKFRGVSVRLRFQVSGIRSTLVQ